MNNNNSNSNKNTHHQQQHHQHYGNEYSLFVGDLPDDCSDDELQRLFQSKFKSVKRVQIIRHEDGKSRGFGFIRFEDRHDFQAALSQEMRIGNKLLRLDTAHRSFKNRSRYPSINSSGSNSSHQQNHYPYNNSNNSSNTNNNNSSSGSSNNGGGSGLHHHHHHHHNQSHHHQQHHHNQTHQQHLNSAQHQQQQPQPGQNTKTLTQDQLTGNQQSHHSGPTDGPSRVNNSLHHAGMNATNSATPTVHHHPHAHHHQQHNSSHNAHLNHSLFNPSQQKNSQRQQTAGNRSPKQQPQPSLTLGGDDAGSQSQTKQSIASPQTRSNLLQQHQQPPPTQPIAQVTSSAIGLTVVSSANITTTSTSAVTSLSSSDASSQSSSAIVANQPNINTTGHAPIGHDFRGYPQTAILDNPHLLGATDPASVVPPSSVYGHMYPYGPPSHFGYMPQPQPNQVIPISAGPPLPPNQGSSSTGVGPQHSLPTANTTRYGNAQHHHPQAQHLAGVPDASAMNTMTAGVQAPHQAPFYYYYPNPFYFDQSGAGGAPPNMYHPQTLHPQFFALPNPAFMPNAHAYTNQQQTQPPTAPQSEATTTLVNQSQPPQPPQSHQQQVNIRTRDIDAPIE